MRADRGPRCCATTSTQGLLAYTREHVPPEPADIVPGLYAAFATVVLFIILGAVFVGATTTAQGTVAVAGVGSGAIGFFSVTRGLTAPLAGALQFARPWLWFTVWAAVGLYDGRYQPMVASAAMAVAMAVCYLVGGGVAALRRGRL
jgi:hypothetical protein